MKSAIILVLGIALGYFLGSSTQFAEAEPKDKMTVDAPICPPEQVIDCTESKESLSETFLMFLAGVGVKLSQSDQEQLKNLLVSEGVSAPSFEELSSEPEPELVAEVVAPNQPTFSSFADDFREQNDDHSHSKGSLKDPSVFLAKSVAIQKYNNAIKKAQGRYFSELHYINPKPEGEREAVFLDINYQETQNQGIEGDFLLELSRGGEVYSTSSGSGGNRNIKTRGLKLLLQVNDSSFFLLKGKSIIGDAEFYKDGKFVAKAKFIRQ